MCPLAHSPDLNVILYKCISFISALLGQDPALHLPLQKSDFPWITPAEALEPWCGGTKGGYCRVLQKAPKD